MKKLNKREMRILFITFGLALFFIVYQFMVKPMLEGAMDINDQLRVEKGRLFKARQMVAKNP